MRKALQHIIMTSGGVGSAVTLKMVVETYGKENVISLFADTMMEDEDLYRFLEEVHNKLEVPLTRVADGRNPWEVFRDVRFVGNSRVDPCSRVLKRQFLDDWIKARYLPQDVIVWVGIDCSEVHRLRRLEVRKLPYVYRSILVERDINLSETYKDQFYTSLSIQKPHLYSLGFSHNNCGGFCVKAGLGQFRNLFEKLPARYLAHEKTQEQLMAENPNLRPFLRKQVKGEVRYLTLREFREEFLESEEVDNSDLISIDEMLEGGGCGCALE